jgi:hypothetical protein
LLYLLAAHIFIIQKTLCMLSGKHLSPGFRGAIGKMVVVKQYAGKTVLTAYPDMRSITPSGKQQQKRQAFAEAAAYASRINNDPVQKALFAKTLPPGTSVYHAALRYYLQCIKNNQ